MDWVCRLRSAANLKSGKLRLAKRYIYIVTLPWTSLIFLSCKIQSWQINSLYPFLAEKKSTFGKWIARTWLSAVSPWEGRQKIRVHKTGAPVLGQWHYRRWHLCFGEQTEQMVAAQWTHHRPMNRGGWAPSFGMEWMPCPCQSWASKCLVNAPYWPASPGYSCSLFLQKEVNRCVTC